MNRVKVVSVDNEGKEKTVYVIKPTTKHMAGARKAAGKAVKLAIEEGCYFREKLDKVMREQGLWDDEQQKRVDELNEKVSLNVKKLKKGNMDLEEAKKLALQIKQDRAESLILLAKTRELDSFTIEGQSENASFEYLLSQCIVNEEGNPIFANVDEYLENSTEPYIGDAAAKLSELVYGLDSNWEKKLPENEFLIKYKFCNEDLNLINEEGKRVSINGKLIDENGRYVDNNGKHIDIDGDEIDEDGDYVDFKPFTKNGEPVA